jgi:lysophospholipase L1-like esterase
MLGLAYVGMLAWFGQLFTREREIRVSMYRHFARAVTVSIVVLSVGVAAPSIGSSALPTAASRPTAVVALGDSFISGEGAGVYEPVADIGGSLQSFPGWSAPNNNAFFCHRSANASVRQAALPGIQARFNLACSGGQPHDLVNAGKDRPKGRMVAAQLDQVRAVARTHDIDLVLVGLGSNNSSFTFGDVATKCAYRFIADAWTGWWEFWAYLGGPIEQRPCTAEELASVAALAAATEETVAAVRQLMTTLDEVDQDGQHRVVFQDYTNPLPIDFHPAYHRADGRDDSRDKFRALGAKRYAGGCPVHRASLAAGHIFSAALGTLVHDVHETMSAEFPAADLVYLNVQEAFRGARLCESSTSPSDTLVTPIRLQEEPTGEFVTDLSGYDKIDIQNLADTCLTHFQTCQESWHPNAAGYAVLGQCLTGAAVTVKRSAACTRSNDGTVTVS